MPLKKGKSKKVVSENISMEMGRGMPRQKAIADAMTTFTMAKKKPKKKKGY